jgi:hypothetical protein
LLFDWLLHQQAFTHDLVCVAFFRIHRLFFVCLLGFAYFLLLYSVIPLDLIRLCVLPFLFFLVSTPFHFSHLLSFSFSVAFRLQMSNWQKLDTETKKDILETTSVPRVEEPLGGLTTFK